MFRQLLIYLFPLVLGPLSAHGALNEKQTLTVPPDTREQNTENKSEDSFSPNTTNVVHDQGLDMSRETQRESSRLFHLVPSPSVTFALHQAYDFEAEDNSLWGGVHVAPWMGPTHRIQAGLDIHERFSWLQLAYHVLPSRNLTRWYWGGGVSSLMDGRENFRSLMKTKNYYAFAAGGWEAQISRTTSLRFEGSFHRSTHFSLARATIGYTLHF